MDTSDERNKHNIKSNCEQYRKLLETLTAEEPDRSAREIWLAMHQPLWGRSMNGEQETTATSLTATSLGDADGNSNAFACVNGETESALPVFREKFALAKDKRLARLQLAGDTHAFQFFWPNAGPSPIQIVAGNGGTKLDKLYPLLNPGTKAPAGNRSQDGSAPIVHDVTSWGIAGKNLTLMQHGFTVLQRLGTLWTATQFDRDGKEVVTCRFSEAHSSASADLAGCDQVLARQASSN
jgi:hypothetical protein